MKQSLPKLTHADPTRHQRSLLRAVLIIIFIFSLVIGSINVALFSAYQIATFNFISVLVSALIWYYYHRSRNLKVASWLVTGAILFNLACFISLAKGGAYSLIWITIIPPLVFFLLGRRAGSWVTALAYSATLLYLYVNLSNLPPLSFGTGAMLNIAEVMLVHWFLFRHYESSRKSAYAELAHLSESDRLTGVYNRGKLDALLEQTIQEVQEKHTPACLMLIDIDHFKEVNDSFGHLVGDQVLKQVAVTLKRNIREGDAFGRWGGEEFMLICTHTELEHANQLAEDLRQRVMDTVVTEKGPITISIGLVQIDPTLTSTEAIQFVDRALYKAKASGRNTVIIAQSA
ncbi:GGDEF domain-containing protein [Aliidiomarina indica]|uniref:GGDEF domain-containing protein n=1 Tax=Aliidiomarina indica TaxID=2749147 RepID=UPI00188E13CF|nr:GGDEF domain-containing protein [Aliidiomarina indica]